LLELEFESFGWVEKVGRRDPRGRFTDEVVRNGLREG
jgi:hypothetical protein